MEIDPNDPRLSWDGAVSLERGAGFIKPWRLPFDQRVLFGKTSVDDMLLSRAGMAAGVRIVFRSDTSIVEGRIDPIIPNQFNVAETRAARVDLVCDGKLHSTFSLGENSTFRFDKLPGGEKLIELWLPEYREIRLRSLIVSDGAKVASHQDARPRWIIYGSSNTQSRGASSPFHTWPATAARRHNVNHVNLGYGGECHLDSMVARVIRDMPAALIGVKAGINIYIAGTLNARAFRAALIGFVQIVREGHPRTPLVITSAIYGWERETAPNVMRLTLSNMREIVQEAVEACRSTGDDHIHYINGLDLLGEPEKHLLPDHLHPDATGYKTLGERFAARVASLLAT